MYDILVGLIKYYGENHVSYIALYFRNTCNHIILKRYVIIICNYLDYGHCLSKSYEFNKYVDNMF